MERCSWCLSSELYMQYHDNEWGTSVYDDDQKQFEFLVLESAQAGLSWITVLKKRENYRQAYDGFDVKKVAAYNEVKLAELLNNPGIIRNKMKIEASINNARCFLKVQEEFGSFCKYIWGFVGDKPIINEWKTLKEIPATTELSDRLSKDMKKRGFKFLGSTVIYAHLQAIGIVNDHLISCFRRTSL